MERKDLLLCLESWLKEDQSYEVLLLHDDFGIVELELKSSKNAVNMSDLINVDEINFEEKLVYAWVDVDEFEEDKQKYIEQWSIKRNIKC